jgi:hypothetical protein
VYFEAFSTEFELFFGLSQNEYGLAPLCMFGDGEHVFEGFGRNVRGTAERAVLGC